ncbi:hypothetical protein F4677DRAFT_16152 [Hypoxylon crocopeplum]|nr:hypothetical protein F4677DRAFT_16152 [Hypoxylon crocopeplum]
MAKKKKGKKTAGGQMPPKVVLDWNEYFGPGDLQDWQRLMVDLCFDEEFTSKTQCRKALKHVWVNIVDFLADIKAGCDPYRFDSESQLSRYTKETRKIYPKRLIPKGSPLRSLLANIF